MRFIKWARQDLNREALLRNNKACELQLKQDPTNESLVEKPIHSVRPSGLEPETYCLEGSCSIQLSYGRKIRLQYVKILCRGDRI